jgi:VanZ family protein
LIAYGSLFPFTGWSDAGVEPFGFLTAQWPAHHSRPDILTNVLAYIPLGLLLVLWWRSRRAVVGPVIVATIAGGALSFLMEGLQQFLPSRDASVMDLITNVFGTFIGAVLASFVRSNWLLGRVLLQWRARWVKPGRLFDLGLLAIGAWALSQVTPLVPSLDVGKLREGVAPLWHTLHHPEHFNSMQAAVYALYIAGLALLARTLGNPGRAVVGLFFAFVAAVLLYKIPAVSRQLSLEALGGALAAAALTLPFLGLRTRAMACTSALLILAGFSCAELASGSGSIRFVFNWLPFRGQMENTLTGIASTLEFLWPAAALAYLARLASTPEHRRATAWCGGAALSLAAFVLEWHQQFIPGRYGDVTAVLLMAAAWFLYWMIPSGGRVVRPPDASAVVQRHAHAK